MRRIALHAYIAEKMEIDKTLARIEAMSDDHFNTAPNEIYRGQVGTLAHYAEPLKRITDSTYRGGGHAE